MKLIFKPGDKKHFSKTVAPSDTATFDTGQVHPVYATFALGRDAEWVCRLFVIDMKEADEEGIGTFLEISHQSPALQGDSVDFTATLLSINGNEVVCAFEARVGSRVVATGKTGQKVLKKARIQSIFEQLKSHNNL